MTSQRPGEEPPTGGTGRVRLTPARDLVVAALLGALGTWLGVRTFEAVTGSPPLLPWVGPLALWFVAALVAGTARIAHVRLRVRRERVDPGRAVTFLVLGKAAALGGVLSASGYLVFALMFVDRWEAPEPRARVIRGLVAVFAGVATAVAGLLLERACRVDDTDPDGDSSDRRRR